MLVRLICMAFLLMVGQSELWAGRVLFAKLEPYETYHVKAAVSGQVVMVRRDLLGKLLADDAAIIRIDDKVDKELLWLNQQTKESLLLRIQALEKNFEIQKQIAADIAALTTKSRIQKDAEQVNAINAQIALAQAKEQLYNLNAEIAQRQDTIEKKTLKYQGHYFYKVHVTEGDFVSSGTPLVDVMDISQAKITFFLTQEEIQKLKNGQVFVEGVMIKPEQIQRVYQVADSENVSEYRVEVVLKGQEFFSGLMRIEVKD